MGTCRRVLIITRYPQRKRAVAEEARCRKGIGIGDDGSSEEGEQGREFVLGLCAISEMSAHAGDVVRVNHFLSGESAACRLDVAAQDSGAVPGAGLSLESAMSLA